MLAVKVHRANLHGTKAGVFVAVNAYRNYPTIEKFSGDVGYKGSFKKDVKAILNIETEISEKIKAKGFHVIPKRWGVEKSFCMAGKFAPTCKRF